MKVPKIRLQWFLSVGEGRQLEIIATDENGQDLPAATYPLGTIIADEEDESLLLAIYTEKGMVHIPVSALKEAFDMAANEVHSEKWFEENVYKDQE
jgi:hypothetical protein